MPFPNAVLMIYGTDAAGPGLLNPTRDQARAAIEAADAVLWWASGTPLSDDHRTARVVDHIRLFAREPALHGARFISMRQPYDPDLPLPAGQNCPAAIVAEVPRPEAISPAERHMLAGMGAHWAVCGPTSATLVACARDLPVIGMVSTGETLSAAVDDGMLQEWLDRVRTFRHDRVPEV